MSDPIPPSARSKTVGYLLLHFSQMQSPQRLISNYGLQRSEKSVHLQIKHSDYSIISKKLLFSSSCTVVNAFIQYLERAILSSISWRRHSIIPMWNISDWPNLSRSLVTSLPFFPTRGGLWGHSHFAVADEEMSCLLFQTQKTLKIMRFNLKQKSWRLRTIQIEGAERVRQA